MQKMNYLSELKAMISRVPVIGAGLTKCYRLLMSKSSGHFTGSADYWEQRYQSGGNSGAGSYGGLAEFKAAVLNDFVKNYDVHSVIELGCGDGNQLRLAQYPEYLGFDISDKAIKLCRDIFEKDSTKSFKLMSEYEGQKADMVISLDVIYHLIEDEVYQQYMRALFRSAVKYVVVYSSNWHHDLGQKAAPHVRHRKFDEWIKSNEPDWALLRHIPNMFPFNGDYRTSSFADFFIYHTTS